MDDAGRVRRIALTGGIATGKSHVRAHFERRGVPTLDADALAREVVAPGTPGFAAVVGRFGPSIVAPDGQLDRRALGAVVFSDPEARRDLEAIIHPAVRLATDRWFASLDPRHHRFAIADVPLLFEIGRDRDFDAVIVTACEPQTQVERVMHRDQLSDTEARQRIAAQLPQREKIASATYVIRTDGAIEETNRQVDDVLRRLRAS